MTPEQWKQVDELFHSALACDPYQREAFLAQACGGDELLHREVESLISFHEGSTNFIETPADDLAAELLGKSTHELEAGQEIAHYKIRSSLGAGGMGEVYLAEDTRLGRRIALKLLPAQSTTDPERVRRFEQEARAASALNHPNIVTIHEIGRAGSTQFIATEFIDGETLRKHLARGAMKLDEVLDMGIQVSSALTEAHAAGIVHRDIKPENIMLRRDGIVKVLDFGLAKLTSEQEANRADTQGSTMVDTNPRGLLGTVQYMSPEQTQGLDVDARTDIWSLGVVLYEMATGRVPFAGETPNLVVGAILESEPPPLRSYSDLPVEFESIIGKTLHKNREERYQTVGELALDLKNLKQSIELVNRSVALPASRWANRRARWNLFIAVSVLLSVTAALVIFSWMNKSNPPATEPAVKSLAILPFKPLAADKRNESLELGMAETLINKLSGIKHLVVRSVGTVRKYTGLQQDPLIAGRELKVDYVLDSHLQMEGEDIRATVRLLSVKDGATVWTDMKCEKACTDLFEVQDGIAGRIARGLSLRLTGVQERQLAKHYTDNIVAYHLYNLGLHSFDLNSKETYEKSIDYYQQAIQKDPNYALAYVRLGGMYRYMESRGFLRREEAHPKGKSALLKALELDDSLAEAHAALGTFKGFDYEWAEAEKEFTRALELDPNSDLVNSEYSLYLGTAGRPDEAVVYAIRARELGWGEAIGNVAYAYLIARDFDKAIELYREVLEKQPNTVQPHVLIGEAYLGKGMLQEAVAEIEKAVALGNDPQRWDRHPMLAYAYAVAGMRDEALKILHEQHRLAKRGYISPYNFAIIYTGLGDKDRAFEWLEKGYEQRTMLVVRLKSRPIFDPLRSDPRYAELLRRMNLSP